VGVIRILDFITVSPFRPFHQLVEHRGLQPDLVVVQLHQVHLPSYRWRPSCFLVHPAELSLVARQSYLEFYFF